MTNRELLLDNYEDASFALLMEDFSQYRGEKFMAENERLEADPDAAVPELITRRSLNFIHNEFSKNKRNSIAGKLGKKFLRFLAVAALVTLLFSAAYALSPQFRAGTLNLLMQFDEKVATFQFTQDKDSDGMPALEGEAATPTIETRWLPAGFTQHAPVSTNFDTSIECSDETGNLINICVYRGIKTTHSMDVENVDYYEELTIHENPAVLVLKENTFSLVWVADYSGIMVHIYSNAVDADTLIQIAEGLTVSW